MTIVLLADMRTHLNLTDGVGEEDDDLIEGQIEAAQGHVERLLGFKIEDEFGGVDQDPIPAELKHAVKLLAAHWYENREATLVGVSSQDIPHGIWSIVNEHRSYSFDG